MNHHTPDVTASAPTAKRPTSSPPSSAPATPPRSAVEASDRQQAEQPTPVDGDSLVGRPPPRSEVDTLQRSRERAREEDGEHETEQPGRLANVVGRREGLSGHGERVSPNAEPGRDGSDDRRTDALGHERGDDDHQREERDERLPGQRDAAIDELDLEHALPHPPQKHVLHASPAGWRCCCPPRCCLCTWSSCRGSDPSGLTAPPRRVDKLQRLG